MARINLEDSLLKDDKFTDLCIKLGSRILALGTVAEAFILAQKHYLDESNDRLIPLNEWTRKKDLWVLLQVGLAEEFDKGIYIKGSESSFKWLLQRSDAGKKSAALKQNKDETKSTVVERNSTDEYGSQPPTLSLSPTLYSNSNSSLNLVCSEPEKPIRNRPKKIEPKFPIKFSESLTIEVKQTLLVSWSDTYPKEYLDLEFKKARSWIIANDHKTPRSERGWATFLNSWLNRGWDQYRKTLQSNPPKVTVEDLEEMLGKGF